MESNSETKEESYQEEPVRGEGVEEKGKVNDEPNIEDYDLSTPCWFYLDSNDLKQGPFTFKEMFLWWKGSYFPNELMVKTIWETDFQQLGNIPEFVNAPPKLVEKIEKEQDELVRKGHIEVPMVPTYFEGKEEEPAAADSAKFDEYSVKGTFNTRTGTFTTEPGGPIDREARMMSKYFDYNQYQSQMVNGSQDKKKKPVKGTKKFWKERKEKKKRAKLLAEYLAD